MHEWEDFLLQVLVQLIAIIASARVGAWAFAKLGQPQVVGEIATGLLLGPSLLGYLVPDIMSYVFPADTTVVFRVLSELGLMLLMFLVGLEFDFSHLRNVGRTAVGVAAVGIALPFSLGAALALWMHPQVAPEVDQIGFVLIVSIALSITAIPILGRIMIELQIHRTRLGTTTITAAAIDDVIGWILLATASTLIHGDFEFVFVLRIVLLTIAFTIACWLIAPAIFRHIAHPAGKPTREAAVGELSAVLIAVFVAAAATQAIGIFSVFGPFILGAVLSGHHCLRENVKSRLQDVVNALLLPIFFTYTGLRTNIGLLDSPADWLMCGMLILVAIFGKVVGCGLAARSGGLTWRESGCIAVMMNTRALMGLIAINVGRDLGIIPDNVFCMLVIMALVTTFMTTPLLRLLLPAQTSTATV